MGSSDKVKVMIVCLGNICRSPMGEAVMAHVAKERGLTNVEVDSCGTAGYHVGDEPDDRAVANLKQHKVPIKHQAQQISKQHFYDFDYILASDGSNLSSLERVKPKDATAEVRLWGSYDDNQAIRDPYYDGGKEGFEACYQQCVRYSNKFFDAIFENKS